MPTLHSGDLSGLPKTYFAICGMDPLRDDAIIYEKYLREAGVETDGRIYPGLPHCWWSMLPHLKASEVFRRESIEAFAWLIKGKGQ